MKLKRDTVLSGRYNIRVLLGKGGMGVVYRAFDEQLRRMVAIKTIQGENASDKDFLKRFKREALAISQIDHPHIVRLLDFVEGTPDQPPYMVMELLNGQDMSSAIRNEGPLDITRAVTRVLEASVAVVECHRRGYLHRDLKPSNIFLHEYNKVETAKVLDFGAAKQDEHYEGHRDETAELTHKGFFVGTPYYMAPELIARKPPTAKSDQYSLAIVLYNALAGRGPFEVKKANEDFKHLDLAQAIRTGNYTPIDKLRPDIPPELAAAVHKAMSVDPEKRFPDLHAFGVALRPLASPQAKLTWEAHFKGPAPVRQAPQLSVALSAKSGRAVPVGELGDRTIPDDTFTAVTRGTQPTVPAKPANETIVFTTAELNQAAGGLATTSRQPDAERSRSLSLVIDEASEPAASVPAQSSGSNAAPQSSPRSQARNKPAMIALAAAVMLGAVLLFSFALSHHKGAAPTLSLPPADLINRTTTTAPPSAAPQATSAPSSAPATPTPPPAATALVPAARSTPGLAAVQPAPAPTEAPPPTAPASPKHHAHKKTVQPTARDPHGLPIPTE